MKEHENIINQEFVQFIGIGAQKAGTSWLHDRLMELPEFSFPPRKELHYFDRNPKYPSPNRNADPRFFQRMKDKEWTRTMKAHFGRMWQNKNFNHFSWHMKWYLSTYDDRWYKSLFSGLNGIRGEITPSYSVLDESGIRAMHDLIPHAKILLLIRNPIERAWSGYWQFENRHGQTAPKDRIKSVTDFINSDGQKLRSDYLDILKRYSKIYPSDQIWIGFFDAIISQPASLMKEVVSFLGGDPNQVDTHCKLENSSNKGDKEACPPEVMDLLKEKYTPAIQQMVDVFGENSFANRWLETQATEKSNKTTPSSYRLSQLSPNL